TYDASGNLKQDAIWDYEYDGENRLKAIASRIIGNDDRFEYVYDYLGRRVRKQKMHKTTYVVSEDTRYIYVGW
ncbi:MAG TPA: hypothetical protein PLN52_25625, partial [Opitutaceae bacterium]|nr:hypothetical protein [Opitutaceae bacterium]